MSLAMDVPASAFEAVAPSLLARVEEMTRLLATSAEVPDDVREFVESFDDLFRGHDPEAGLAGIDPYLAVGLLGGAVVCLKALTYETSATSRRVLRLGLEQVRQALRDITDEAPTGDNRTGKEVARWLAATLGVPQSELAVLVGISPRTFQRWVSPGDAGPTGDDEARVRLIARIANHLRHSFTGPGVLRWFERPHPLLQGRKPIELLDDPSQYPGLARLAARARSMVAT